MGSNDKPDNKTDEPQQEFITSLGDDIIVPKVKVKRKKKTNEVTSLDSATN